MQTTTGTVASADGTHSDRVDRESTRILGGVLPDVRTVILPGLAHQPDPPAPVAEALFGFLGPGG